MSLILLEPAPCTRPVVRDRRRDRRYLTPAWPVFLSAAINALAGDARPFGHVRDIGRRGMRIGGLRFAAIGGEIDLCIALPPSLGPAARQRANLLKVTARPLWVADDEMGEGFEMGYVFVAPAKATLRRIETLVATLVETA